MSGAPDTKRYKDRAGTCRIIYVVGVGPGEESLLTPEAREIISGSRYVAGGRDLLSLAASLAPEAETFVIDADLEAAIASISARLEIGDVCVMASGDPGCFSILPLLAERYGRAVRVVPGISSVQLLAARLAVPWQSWKLVSLHGRGTVAPAPPRSATVYFCDSGNSPQAVAESLLAGNPDWEAVVGAYLGREDEIVFSGRLQDVAAGEFPGHALLLVVPHADAAKPEKSEETVGAAAPGIPDKLWIRKEKVPLSKSEVRAVLMSKAQPKGRRVIWDVGAGTGSYGVECSLLEPRAHVIAIDKNPDACHLVAENAERFGAAVEIVCAEAPEGFETLARPDLVIVGGNEGMLSPIFKAALGALQPGGRIAVTALLDETRRTAHKLFAESGLANRSATRVSISRGEGHEWVDHNPVVIFTGDKQ